MENKLGFTEEQLAPTPEEREQSIFRKIKYPQTARIVLWLALRFEKEDFVYSTELVKAHLVPSSVRAYQVLKDLEYADLIYSIDRKAGCNEWHAVKNGTVPKIFKYVPFCLKILGIQKSEMKNLE